MSGRKLVLTVCLAGISCHVMAANKGDLTIYNNSKHALTMKINHSMFCSTDILGEAGITRPGKFTVTKKGTIETVCAGNTEKCPAEIYMSDDCGRKTKEGPTSIATYSVKDGVLSYTPPKNGYVVKVSGKDNSEVTVSGGPA